MQFVLKQTVRFLLLMLAVSVVVFVLVGISPIDPVQANVGQAAYLGMSEEARARLAEYWGVGAPLWERYANWLGGVLHGDWGTSLRYNAPVVDVIANRVLNSLALMAVAWIVSGVLGFVLGIVAAVYRGSWADRAIKGYCYLLASTPTFWLGLMLLVVFAVQLGWFPIGFSVPIGRSAADVTLADAVHHLVLPAATLSIVGVANIALHTREKAIDVLESEYVRFARARGLSTREIMRRHGLRNLALPAITLQFASISEIFGGSVLVEQVFSYPGLGQAAVTAGLGSDVALLAGIAVVSAALVFGGNLVANLLYGAIDPRMRRATGSVRRDARAHGPESARSGEGEAPNCSETPRNGEGVRKLQPLRVASVAKRPVSLTLHRPRAKRLSNRALTLAVFVLAVGALAAIVVAGVTVQGAATEVDFVARNLAPSADHPFGTDWMGRDMLLRTLAGLSTSVLVGLLAAGCSSVIALALGTVAALGGKRADAAVSWLIDLLMGLPHIVLLILISYALGKGFWGVTVGVALTHWPSLARVVRAEVLQCREANFVAVARQLGKSRAHLAVRHMLPYVLPQFVVGLILLFPHAILHEAAITFLGFGLPPEQPAIGVILSEAMSYLSAGMWWLAVFPGVALIAVVLLFDLAGSCLRTLVDPHRSQE